MWRLVEAPSGAASLLLRQFALLRKEYSVSTSTKSSDDKSADYAKGRGSLFFDPRGDDGTSFERIILESHNQDFDFMSMIASRLGDLCCNALIRQRIVVEAHHNRVDLSHVPFSVRGD